MTRFCKQRDDHSCGPVAVLNALNWAGSSWFTYDRLSCISMLCKTDEDGTDDESLDDTLRFFQEHDHFKTVRPKNTDFDRIAVHLENGGAMIAAYQESSAPKDWHYALFIEGEDGRWNIVNHSTGNNLYTEHQVDPKRIYNRLDKLSMWLITR